MKDMEREKSEESWKKAFEQAEVSPSNQVWTNIELELEKAKGGELKRRLLFYKLLAAASVIFAMAIGGAGYYQALIHGNETSANLAVETRTAEEAFSGSEEHSPQIASAESHNRKSGSEQNNTVKSNTASEEPTEKPSARLSEETLKPNRSADRQPSIASLDGQHVRSGGNDTNAITRQNENRSPLEQSGKLVTPNGSTVGADQPALATHHQSTTSDDAAPRIGNSDTPRRAAGAGTGVGSKEHSMELFAVTSPAGRGELPYSLDDDNLPPLYTPRDIQLAFPAQSEQQVDPVVAMLAKLEQRQQEIEGEKKNEKDDDRYENLWTSVGFSAGSFTSVQGASSNPPSAATLTMDATAPVVDEETSASGYSYSMGVNVGTRLSERWVLQGGVNYLTHASEYTANNVVETTTGYQQKRFRAMSTNELINADVKELSSKIALSGPYSVNNSMRYLSIPMQAGYLLVDKTFGLQLNAGVATDLFLQNTIKADSDHLDRTSQSAGEDSPYRAVNLSGLFGTEMSYRFSDNYRISLNPGIRYPFNTIYKSELGVRSSPLAFDIGLRFRYIFH